jgi:hypothetical protein
MYVAASPVADNFDMSPVKREDNLLEKRDMRCSVVRNQKCNWGPGSKSSARTTIKPSHGVFGVRCICPQENYIWGWIPGWGCFTTVPGLKCQSMLFEQLLYL